MEFPYSLMTTDPYIYRVIGIDPGSTSTGVSVLDFNLVTHEVTVVAALTLNAGYYCKDSDVFSLLTNYRYHRITWLMNQLIDIYTLYCPHYIIAESPFAGANINAFEALVEVRQTLMLSVYNYNTYLTLDYIDPPTVKKSVGVFTRSNDKELMKSAVVNTMPFTWNPSIAKHLLTEHAIDSIAVAYSYIKLMKDNNKGPLICKHFYYAQ